jgi:hypothetical protein
MSEMGQKRRRQLAQVALGFFCGELARLARRGRRAGKLSNLPVLTELPVLRTGGLWARAAFERTIDEQGAGSKHRA